MTPNADLDTSWVDLHLHSACSDGAETPEALACRAAAQGLAAMALTDHDTVSGLSEARRAAIKLGVGFLDGVEISAEFETREVHIVGLGITPNAALLTTLLQTQAARRHERIQAIVHRLQHSGLPVTLDSVMTAGNVTAPGRMHVAVALREMGTAPTVQKAFEYYLNRGKPGYVPKRLPAAVHAIEAIHTAGGLAFLAHPGIGHWTRKRLDAMLEMPFDGLEAWHVSHTKELTTNLILLAETRGLLVSGGSDCHGGIKKDKPTLGRVRVPYPYFNAITSRLQKQR